MKNHLLLVAIMPILICACSSFDDKNAININSSTPDLYASFADEETTKTYVENNKYLRWHEDDRLTAFYGNTLNRQYKFNGETGDNSGTFSLVPSGEICTGNAFDRIYAVYPYNETATITDEGVISLTLPATQSYAENSFGHNANTMIAVTENLEDTFLAFKNACGYLKLHLYAPEGGTIKSIEIKGNNNEKIAGNATATIAFGEAPVITMADDATTSILLDCGEGVTLGTTAETATEFWVVIPETTFTSGLTITVTDRFDAAFTKSTSNKVVIERNEIQPMVAVAVVCERIVPANNEIWYTSTDGTVVMPYAKGAFGANIVSNVYENGKGIITFDSAVDQVGTDAFKNRTLLESIEMPHSITAIGGYAFYRCTSLTSITIPDSVTKIGGSAFYGCSGLISVTIPNSVVSFGQNAFYNCEGKLIIDNKIVETDYGLNEDTNPTSSYNYAHWLRGANFSKIILSDNIRKIGDRAFAFMTSLTEIAIGEKVTFIGDSACSNTSLTEVIVPDNVVEIKNHAFSCKNISRVYLGKSITAMYEYAFSHSDSSTPTCIYIKSLVPPLVCQYTMSSNVKEIYVPREAYEDYTRYSSSYDYNSLCRENWYACKSRIRPYDFE